jgi:hypothetical protein
MKAYLECKGEFYMMSKASEISAYLESYDADLLRKQIEENFKKIEQSINELKEVNKTYINQ